MKVSVNKSLEIEIADYELNTTLKDYLDRRQMMGAPIIGLQDCFICEKRIEFSEKPRIVSIKNQSSRLICEKCYNDISNKVESDTSM